MRYTGLLFVLVGPSGTGKNTIITSLLREHSPGNLRQLATVTTRPKRESETEGREHYFVTEPRFHELIDAGALIEYQLIHKQWSYGTPHEGVKQAINTGEDLIADIDVFGAKALKSAFPENVILIFIAPPDSRVLEERIRNRDSDSEETIRTRLERAAMERTYIPECDYVVVNDDLEQAVQLVKDILVAHKNNLHVEDRAAFAAHAWIAEPEGVLTVDEKLPCAEVEKRETAISALKSRLTAQGILAEDLNGHEASIWYHRQHGQPMVDVIVPMRAVQIPDSLPTRWQQAELIPLPSYIKELMVDLRPTFE
ncbi:MAG: guanylate kinase [Anaerolineae bacterium]|nr:guanylate kinase [Anaerolineae bacterium]